MKKILKASFILLSALLIFGACDLFPEGKIIGTVDGKNIYMQYYEEIFPPEAASDKETTANNPLAESEKQKQQEAAFDKTSAVLITILTPILKNPGGASADRQKLNTSINNLKSQYGDKYLEEAENRYHVPIQTEKDLIRIMSFSLLYANYLERVVNMSNAQISQLYYEKYKTKYCASHILTENEAQAQNLLNQMASGQKTFQDYITEGQQIAAKNAAENPAAQPAQTLNVKDATIAGVPVKEIADLNCQSASTYVPEFAAALTKMQIGQTSTSPVKTEFGYHIINVSNIEEHELTKDLQEQIKTDFVSSKQATPGFTSYYGKELLSKVQLAITDENVKKIWDEYVTKQSEEATKYQPPTPAQ